MYISSIKEPTTSGKINIIVFPAAGMISTSMMRFLMPYQSDKWVFHCVDYPGRGVSAAHSSVNSFNELCYKIFLSLQPLLDSPIVLMGHSFGAYIALEVARLLQLRQTIHAKALILSGMKSVEHIHNRDFESLLSMNNENLLHAIGVTLSDAYADMRQSIIEWIRLDLKLLSTYQFKPCRYRSNLYLFHGTRDRYTVESSSLEYWAKLTNGNAQHTLVEAGHTFDESYMKMIHQYALSSL